jgi:DNA-binding transcriptional regulator LsrR (DeoR family)
VAHANAVLTPVGRRLLVDRVLSGRPQSHVAKELGVSRQCVARWVSRFQSEGVCHTADRHPFHKHCAGTAGRPR